MKLPLSPQKAPTIAATLVMLAIFAGAGVRFDGFASLSNLGDLFGSYAYIAIAAIGATFVIISGGIDLSVGSVVAFSGVLVGSLIDRGWHPLAAGAAAIACGALLGSAMGAIVQGLGLPAFIVTLAAMFGMRAACFVVVDHSRPISHPFLEWAAYDAKLSFGSWSIDAHTERAAIALMLLLFALAALLARRIPLGTAIFALGGSERGAQSMGVPIARARILTYTLAGACSALAGVVFAFGKASADPTSAAGLELTVIAAVVIGGTSLAGGVGSVWGTLVGVMIIALIRAVIDFEGSLNAAWTSVATGGLVLVFVVLQRGITALAPRGTTR